MLYLLWNVNFFCSLHFQMQLPWKSLKSIVEYYYMWKTTDRYVQQVSRYLFAVFCCFSLFCLALKKKNFFKLWTNWNIVLLCTIKRSCAVDSESSEGLRCLFKFAFVAKSSPSCLHRGLVQCHGDQGATCRVEQTVVFLLCLVIYTVMTVFATIVCRNASRQQKQKASWNRSTFLTSK